MKLDFLSRITLHADIYVCLFMGGLVCLKLVSRAWNSNYIPYILRNVITYACPRCLLLVYKMRHMRLGDCAQWLWWLGRLLRAERACGRWYLHLLDLFISWWRHQMETFSELLTICAGNSPVTGEFTAQRPVTRSFDVFFDLRLNKRLNKQSWGWWFETLLRPL